MTEYVVEFHEVSGGAAKREEIVRCRECAFFGSDELGCFCSLFGFEDADEERQLDGFCAWGERKER